jgi:glycosyltransferase involved in cell wall biosynthesis
MLKKFFQRVAGFLVIGSHNAEFYQDFGVPKQKMCMTPYAVDNEYFMREADSLVAQRNEIRRRFEFPESLPLILFTGKLRDVKQPRALIEAYAQVVRKTPCALVFVGDGPLRADLEAYKQDHKLDHVYFVGFRNQSELPNFYATADVFVLPSKIEPWGLVINEAMCFGLPILTTDRVGAGKDLVQPGLNGFIFPADSVEALENYLTLVLSDSELRREMGIKSREIIRKWSYETGVNNLVVWLEQMRSTPKR